MFSQKMLGLNGAVTFALPLDRRVLAPGALGAQLCRDTPLQTRCPQPCPDPSIPAHTATCRYKHKTSFGKKNACLGS